MAKAPESTVTPEDIVFELERFESSGGRLELSGRWFGVRGRRFVRPTLTLDLDTGRVRALADLDDKPWAAEDGEPWTASFPWSSQGRVEESELSVAPDIAIQLPAPSARRSRTQRLSAVPRREAMTASWGDFAGFPDPEPPVTDPAAPESAEVREATSVSAPVAELPTPDPDPATDLAELEALRAELAEAAGQLASTSAQLEAARDELVATRSQLEAARAEIGARGGESAAAESELTAARAARQAALRSAARAEAERESAVTRAVQAEAARDAAAAEKSDLAATLELTRASLERLTRERDQAVSSRGAALVMRGATRALPAYESHVGWLRRGLAVLLMIGVVFAALIVLHVL